MTTADDPTAHGAVEAALQLRADATTGRSHPEDHPGDETDREDREHAAERRLRGSTAEQRGLRVRQQRAEPETQPQRCGDAEPDRTQLLAPFGSDQVGDAGC